MFKKNWGGRLIVRITIFINFLFYYYYFFIIIIILLLLLLLFLSFVNLQFDGLDFVFVCNALQGHQLLLCTNSTLYSFLRAPSDRSSARRKSRCPRHVTGGSGGLFLVMAPHLRARRRGALTPAFARHPHHRWPTDYTATQHHYATFLHMMGSIITL